MLVVDASVLAVALLDDGPDGDHLRARLRGEELAAPSLIDLEVVSVWRGLARGGQLHARRVAYALDDLRALPLQRVDHGPLIMRCWELRENLTVYDASYIDGRGAASDTPDRGSAHRTGARSDVPNRSR